MRKVIFVDGFLKTEVEKLSIELGMALDGFEKKILPKTFKEFGQLISELRQTQKDYIFCGSPYGNFIDTLFGTKKLVTSSELILFENNFSGFFFFVDASNDYITQTYKALNKKLTKNDLARIELYRFVFSKSTMPLKLTYSVHEPNAKAKFLEEFKEVYTEWLIETTDYKLLQTL